MVDSANRITDRQTGRLHGFGFVEMSSGRPAAMEAFHQSELGRRSPTVNVFRLQEESSPSRASRVDVLNIAYNKHPMQPLSYR